MVALLKVILLHLGHIQARILLTIIYFLLVLPLGILARFFSDLLGIKKKGKGTFWITKTPDSKIQESSRKQY